MESDMLTALVLIAVAAVGVYYKDTILGWFTSSDTDAK